MNAPETRPGYRVMTLEEQLRLIERGLWVGLGPEWVQKVAGKAAAEIERLRAYGRELTIGR